MKFEETKDPALRKARMEDVNRRWHGLYAEYLDISRTIVRYLVLVNAGGVVAMLSFMGAMKSLSPMANARLVLMAFSAGLILVGFGLAFESYRLRWLFSTWRDDTAMYYDNELDWEAVLDNDRHRQKAFAWVGDALAWASFISFLIGVGVSAHALL